MSLHALRRPSPSVPSRAIGGGCTRSLAEGSGCTPRSSGDIKPEKSSPVAGEVLGPFCGWLSLWGGLLDPLCSCYAFVTRRSRETLPAPKSLPATLANQTAPLFPRLRSASPSFSQLRSPDEHPVTELLLDPAGIKRHCNPQTACQALMCARRPALHCEMFSQPFLAAWPPPPAPGRGSGMEQGLSRALVQGSRGGTFLFSALLVAIQQQKGHQDSGLSSEQSEEMMLLLDRRLQPHTPMLLCHWPSFPSSLPLLNPFYPLDT